MRKIVLFVALALVAVLAPAPVFACNQICRYSGGGDECITVAWVTGMSCYMSGSVCVDVQELCWASQGSEVAAWGQEEEAAPACLAAE